MRAELVECPRSGLPFPSNMTLRLLPLLLLLPCAATALNPLRQVYYDWVALNSQSTTRHIMRPATAAGKAECLNLKQQLRAEAASGRFVVDVFADAAATHSLDEESRDNGGLIGRRLRQGVCVSPELDRACFCAPLGQVAGPLKSSYGYHLVLVEERIGLTMHDSGMTRVVAEPRPDGNGVKSVLRPPDPNDDGNELLAPVNLVTLVASVAIIGVLGDITTSLATAVDVGSPLGNPSVVERPGAADMQSLDERLK